MLPIKIGFWIDKRFVYLHIWGTTSRACRMGSVEKMKLEPTTIWPWLAGFVEWPHHTEPKGRGGRGQSTLWSCWTAIHWPEWTVGRVRFCRVAELFWNLVSEFRDTNLDCIGREFGIQVTEAYCLFDISYISWLTVIPSMLDETKLSRGIQ